MQLTKFPQVNENNTLQNTASIRVSIGRVPGTIKDITAVRGATLQDILLLADIKLDKGEEIRINGQIANPDAPIENGSAILLTRRIRGNAY